MNGLVLVVACDSCGAIGDKELDVVRVSPYLTGRFTTRVALFEVLATGVQPQIVTAAICNEPVPTGDAILRGVSDELKFAGLGSLPVAISCEKNMLTKQTGLGITVVGMGSADRLRVALTRPGDRVYCLGMPKVGLEVHRPDDPDLVQVDHIQQLLANHLVHDLIPVGSRGILGEIATLASALGLSFLAVPQISAAGLAFERSKYAGVPNLQQSGGPATCVLVTAEPGFDQNFQLIATSHRPVPLFLLGNFQD